MPSVASATDVRSRPVQRALGRSALYRFLSLACGYPLADRVGVIREEALPKAQAGAQMVAPGLVRRLEELGALLAGLEAAHLQGEYHRTLGHIPMPDCAPYESAYVGPNLFQQVNTMADVAGFYRAFGLAPSSSGRERADHVAVELEFMRVLTYKEAVARVRHGRDKVYICRRAQRRFWREHLGTWLPLFARALRAKAGSGFYAGLASLLEGFARAEARELGNAPEAKPAQGPLPPEADCTGDDTGCPLAPP